jgi:CBS domain containing-hemolysin-like protein
LTDAHVALDLYGVAWRLGATLFFVFLNGFFVSAEFALVKVRQARIDQLANEGRRAARTTKHILQHLDRYLSACQLGITLASLILGALGEPAVSVLLIAVFSSFGLDVAQSEWVSILSIGLAFTVITVLHMTVGEQAPKMWALRRSEAIAMRTSGVLRAFTAVFGPFIVVINAISNWMLRLIGLPADLGHEHSPTGEEIRSILTLSASAGHISEREHELTANVFRMIELEVRHVVVPRVDIEFLTLGHPIEENLERVRASPYTRLPVCEVGLDTIVGFVDAKDVLSAALRGDDSDLRDLLKPPLFVSDTMSVSDFLLIGLAFRKDALEEIVGPLADEAHEKIEEFTKLANGGFELSGRMSVPEVEDRLEFELADDEDESEDTIGGHVTARLGRLPHKGDQVRVGPFDATVLEVTRRRVGRLRLLPAPPDETAKESA